GFAVARLVSCGGRAPVDPQGAVAVFRRLRTVCFVPGLVADQLSAGVRAACCSLLGAASPVARSVGRGGRSPADPHGAVAVFDGSAPFVLFPAWSRTSPPASASAVGVFVFCGVRPTKTPGHRPGVSRWWRPGHTFPTQNAHGLVSAVSRAAAVRRLTAFRPMYTSCVIDGRECPS